MTHLPILPVALIAAFLVALASAASVLLTGGGLLLALLAYSGAGSVTLLGVAGLLVWMKDRLEPEMQPSRAT